MKRYDVDLPKEPRIPSRKKAPGGQISDSTDTEKLSKHGKQGEAADTAKEILQTLQSARKEASLLVAELSRENGTIQNLRTAKRDLEAEKRDLENELREKKNFLEQSYEELEAKSRQNEILNAQVNDLDERLKRSLQLDEISKNQDLLLLKSSLSDALKRQYKDYMENREEPCTEENYAAFKTSLEHIFRALKRLDIQID